MVSFLTVPRSCKISPICRDICKQNAEGWRRGLHSEILWYLSLHSANTLGSTSKSQSGLAVSSRLSNQSRSCQKVSSLAEACCLAAAKAL